MILSATSTRHGLGLKMERGHLMASMFETLLIVMRDFRMGHSTNLLASGILWPKD